MLYTLMHRDIPVMDLELDEYSNIVSLGKIHHAEHLPLGTYNKIGVERKALSRWWTKRSIPASRKGIRDVLEELELSSPQELIEKCFGLRVICPLAVILEPLNAIDTSCVLWANTGVNVSTLVCAPRYEACTPFDSTIKAIPRPVWFATHVADLRQCNSDDLIVHSIYAIEDRSPHTVVLSEQFLKLGVLIRIKPVLVCHLIGILM